MPVERHKVSELIFNIHRPNSFSKTFRIFMHPTPNMRIEEILRQDLPIILASHNGAIVEQDVLDAAEAMENVQKAIGQNWYDLICTRDQASGPTKVQVRPGCSVDVYRFEHPAYVETGV